MSSCQRCGAQTPRLREHCERCYRIINGELDPEAEALEQIHLPDPMISRAVREALRRLNTANVPDAIPDETPQTSRPIDDYHPRANPLTTSRNPNDYVSSNYKPPVRSGLWLALAVTIIFAFWLAFNSALPDRPFPSTPRVVVANLPDEIESGRIRLVSATGNGSSSGSAILAELTSAVSTPIRVRINLNRPLYMANSGRGQNMVAVLVTLRDGRYMSEDGTSFITLNPGSQTPVVLVSFCMDFDKANPTFRDGFLVGQMPTDILPVVDRIREYFAANPSADAVTAAQVAIWLAQGVSMRDIRVRFPVTTEDEILARQFTM